MRIAMIASECEPFAKTGGLADVVDALSRALGRAGHEVEVWLPWYRGLVPPPGMRATRMRVPVGSPPGDQGGRQVEATAWSGDAEGYRLRLVEHSPSFDREGLYGSSGSGYPDNAARFSLLGRVMLETLTVEGRPLDIIHGHDWQSGPALLTLRLRYANDPLLSSCATLLTCHNLAYHGWTPRADAWQLDLPDDVGSHEGVDLLREAIAVADLVTTVSPTFARESLTPEYGAGLDDLLRARVDRYLGIQNGIDTQLWDPATDALIAQPYSLSEPEGKERCREDLCARLGLDAAGPVAGVVGRLDPQKGFDLVTEAAPGMLTAGMRLAVLGTGDHALIADLEKLARARPDRLAVVARFDRDMARRIYAGADLFLMPSRFEPSGQGQLIALRYGTIPVVRRVGGLADTVTDADADPERGNGFSFGPAGAAALLGAVGRAMRALSDPTRRRELQRRGMSADLSWADPAGRYVKAYRRALELRRSDVAGTGPR